MFAKNLLEFEKRLKAECATTQQYWDRILAPTGLDFETFNTRFANATYKLVEASRDVITNKAMEEEFVRRLSNKAEFICLNNLYLLENTSNITDRYSRSNDFHTGFLFGVISEHAQAIIQNTREQVESEQDLKRPSNS